MKYDDSGMYPPTSGLTGGEELLDLQLREGAEILRTAPDDFEHLRWFDLPDSAIR